MLGKMVDRIGLSRRSNKPLIYMNLKFRLSLECTLCVYLFQEINVRMSLGDQNFELSSRVDGTDNIDAILTPQQPC